MPRHLSNTCYTLLSRNSRYVHKRKKGGGKCLGLFMLGVCGALGAATISDSTYAIGPVDVSITVPDNPGQGQLKPGSAGIDFSHYQVPVSLGISNAQSFDVYISSTDKDLVGKNFGQKITGLAADTATTMGDFTALANRWGYRWYLGEPSTTQDAIDSALNAKGFKGLTGTGIASRDLITADVATGGNTYNGKLVLEFGATANGDLKSDEYTNNVTISVVATPTQATLFDIETMQEMTHDICKNTPTPNASALAKDPATVVTWAENDPNHYTDDLATAKANPNLVPQKVLKDTRGNGRGGEAKYLVRKLADGNCWMSQNLELDFLGTGQSYYDGVTSDNTAGADAANDNGSVYYTTEDGGRTGLLIRPGMRLTDQDTDLHTTTVWTPENANTTVFATMIGTNESTNVNRAWKNDGSDGMRSYSYAGSKTDGSWNYSHVTNGGNDTNNATFNSSNTGDRFQRYGNLYNWTAATLGSGLALNADNQEAKDSICPKGWKLPANSGDDSFVHLLKTYDNAQNWQGGSNITGYNKLVDSPLDFFRTGLYNRAYGYVNGRTASGFWWSSTSGSATYAHYLNTYPGNVYAQNNHFRGNGFAVRCVAR